MRTWPLLLTLAACGGDDLAPGAIEVRIYGEDFIEAGIPAEVFADGWSVRFDRFVVELGGITAQAGHDADELAAPAFQAFDLAAPSDGAGYLAATLDAPGGVYEHFGYVIDGARVQGVATDGVATITFDWRFPATVAYRRCETAMTVDGTVEAVQATIHGDHLFYDDAVSDEPDVAFQALADADGADGSAPDGEVTAAELAAVDLSAFERYQVGSLPIDDLWAFVSHQVTTVGHVDGEGHCAEIERLE